MRFGRIQQRVVALLIAVTALAPAAWAFLPAIRHHKRDLRAEVASVDEQWRTAQSSNDAAAMDKLLSDDYLGITGSGQVVTKAQQLDRMRSHETNLTRMQMSDMKIKLIGSSAAIVTSSAQLDGTIDGHSIHGIFRSTRVYQHTAGAGWKITNFEATPARGPAPGAGEAGK